MILGLKQLEFETVVLPYHDETCATFFPSFAPPPTFEDIPDFLEKLSFPRAQFSVFKNVTRRPRSAMYKHYNHFSL